jgi:hypothetical protein
MYTNPDAGSQGERSVSYGWTGRVWIKPVEVEDFSRKLPIILEEPMECNSNNQKMGTGNRLNLKTLGYRSIMPKSLRGHHEQVQSRIQITSEVNFSQNTCSWPKEDATKYPFRTGTNLQLAHIKCWIQSWKYYPQGQSFEYTGIFKALNRLLLLPSKCFFKFWREEHWLQRLSDIATSGWLYQLLSKFIHIHWQSHSFFLNFSDIPGYFIHTNSWKFHNLFSNRKSLEHSWI